MIHEWLLSYFQSIDWNSVITAVIFGGLGFLIKTGIDYFKERSIKKAEINLEIRRLLFENKLSSVFKTQQVLLDIRNTISGLFGQLEHIANFARRSDEIHLSYILDTVESQTTDLLRDLNKLNSPEAEIVISDFSRLTELRNNIQQYLSNNGVWRDYQKILIELDGARGDFKKGSKEAKAVKSLESFSKALVHDFKEAIDDIDSNTRNYPTLKELGINIPTSKFDSRELRLNENSLLYIRLLSHVDDFIVDQQLIKIYYERKKQFR